MSPRQRAPEASFVLLVDRLDSGRALEQVKQEPFFRAELELLSRFARDQQKRAGAGAEDLEAGPQSQGSPGNCVQGSVPRVRVGTTSSRTSTLACGRPPARAAGRCAGRRGGPTGARSRRPPGVIPTRPAKWGRFSPPP